MESVVCSTCEAPLDTTGFPKWCKACRAKYRRQYESLKKEMAESRGYAAGISAAREHFASKFAALGCNTFSGIEAAQWVRAEQVAAPE